MKEKKAFIIGSKKNENPLSLPAHHSNKIRAYTHTITITITITNSRKSRNWISSFILRININLPKYYYNTQTMVLRETVNSPPAWSSSKTFPRFSLSDCLTPLFFFLFFSFFFFFKYIPSKANWFCYFPNPLALTN